MAKSAMKVGKFGADLAKPVASIAGSAVVYEASKPRSPKTVKLLRKGIEAFQRGDYSAAYRYFQKAAELNPDDEVNLYWLGCSYNRNREYAIELLRIISMMMIIDIHYYQ